MADLTPAASSSSAARPALSPEELERRRGRPWSLRVIGARDISPHFRRVQLTADNLDEFGPRPGQEIVLQIAQASDEPARRHYTIRRFDPSTRLIDVDFFLHHGGETPGVRWAIEARPGNAIDIRGPRGRIALAREADWHLFSGDETALPAIYALLEAMPPGAPAHAFLEIGADADKLDLHSRAALNLRWLRRDGPPAPNSLLLDAVEGFALPPGRGHAIVLGETSGVRALRHRLLERGVTREQIYAEGYWRPGRIGGHDHVDH
jgi:NADPH-dependent ferric siderophore reductase